METMLRRLAVTLAVAALLLCGLFVWLKIARGVAYIGPVPTFAFWILPRFRAGPERGREWPAWLAYLLLNAGVLTAGLGLSIAGFAGLALAGRSAEGLAAVAFAFHAWPRIKPFG